MRIGSWTKLRPISVPARRVGRGDLPVSAREGRRGPLTERGRSPALATGGEVGAKKERGGGRIMMTMKLHDDDDAGPSRDGVRGGHGRGDLDPGPEDPTALLRRRSVRV